MIPSSEFTIEEIERRQDEATLTFYNDYVERYDEATDFELIANQLGEPLDEEEIRIFAKSAFEILKRRSELVRLAKKISGLVAVKKTEG